MSARRCRPDQLSGPRQQALPGIQEAEVRAPIRKPRAPRERWVPLVAFVEERHRAWMDEPTEELPDYRQAVPMAPATQTP